MTNPTVNVSVDTTPAPTPQPVAHAALRARRG